MYDIEKLRQHFPATTVFKDPSVMAIFKNAKIPAFLRDWILKRQAGPDGRIENMDRLSSYLSTIIPRRSDRGILVDEARSQGETRKFLAQMDVSLNHRANFYTFEIPTLGFTHSQTIIEDYVWERVKEDLLGKKEDSLGKSGVWGLIKLGYMPPEGKNPGRFSLLDFKNFCPYKVDLEAYRTARAFFSIEEWMDILLGAIDYNPDGYAVGNMIKDDIWEAKHTMLTRLLPFVQPRVNLVELAPQQTGKSYIFGKIGKYGWMAGGGSLSRAKLFYDAAARRDGIIPSSDFVAIDEIKSIHFSDTAEMQGILKTYMEDGYTTVGNVRVEGEAGIILLGNIDVNDMDANADMFRELPEVFRDSALIERLHGFILGKKIPALTDAMYMNDWALNSEYFTEILHLLRSSEETIRYRSLVEQLVWTKHGADGREKESVLRLCTAYIKLFFPHADTELIKDMHFKIDFNRYCLYPAKVMRETVLQQMQIINPTEFGHRRMSTYKIRD